MQIYQGVRACYKDKLSTKLLFDAQKHIDDVLLDKFGLDS